MAPSEVTYEDMVSIKAPAAPIHPRPTKVSLEGEEREDTQKESLEHLSSWIPSSQNRQVNSFQQVII